MNLTRGNVRKVSNFGGWECVITSPTGNVGKSYGGGRAEVGAVGSLFAAAPDLLVALRAYVEMDEMSNGAAPENESPLLRRAREALAKAEQD